MIVNNNEINSSSRFPSRPGERSPGLNTGIVGAGGFACFAAKAFSLITGMKIIAVTDINKDAAKNLAGELNARNFDTYEALLNDENIDLVYIATPPFLHYVQSKKALLAGKNVICEKPAAFTSHEVKELQSIARSLQLLYVVNLMQRYNPLYAVVKKIIDHSLLGSFLHGFFENYASDENLGREHWFWDEKKSGGIFIEHGVHFFDMFSGWLGKGDIINAVELQRPGVDAKLIDRVQATVSYTHGIVNFYHGFDQPTILDRQELRLQFEKGEITLYEWVPVKMRLHGLLKKKDLQFLSEIAGDLAISHHNASLNNTVTGRFQNIVYDDHVSIEYGSSSQKQTRYRQILTAMLQDQWNWIRDRTHERIIDDGNAVESTAMAERASKIAQYLNVKRA